MSRVAGGRCLFRCRKGDGEAADDFCYDSRVASRGSSPKARTPIRISDALPYSSAPAQERRRGASSPGSAMSGDLVWNSLNRSFAGSDRGPGKGFHHFTRPFGIADPFVVELIGTHHDAAVPFAGIDHSGVTTVHQLEEMVFGLSVLAGFAHQHLRKLRVLKAVILFATLPGRPAITPDH